jgi:hypothetical protein
MLCNQQLDINMSLPFAQIKPTSATTKLLLGARSQLKVANMRPIALLCLSALLSVTTPEPLKELS